MMKPQLRLYLYALPVLSAFSTLQGSITINTVDDGVGYDETNVPSFRSTSVLKSFDADGDNIYGTEGLFFFGNGDTAPNGTGNVFSTCTDLSPSWVVSVNQGADFSSVAELSSYGAIDTPTLSGDDVVDWEISSAIAVASGGEVDEWLELLTFSVAGAAPTHFRIGVMAGNESRTDGRWDATSFRLSFGDESSAEVTALPNNGNGDPNWVFFDVAIDEGIAGTFSLEGQTRVATYGPSVAGLTFDVHPDAVWPLAPVIELFTVAHTAVEGVGKIAWSVSDATDVSILDASDEAVDGASGLEGVIDISYVAGATYTLVAKNGNVGITETRSIPSFDTLEDTVTFTFDTATVEELPDSGSGIGRRDPSDVIKVGDTWHVWYSRMVDDVTTGYDASVWHATSTDEGYTWVEQGEVIPRGSEADDWDVTSTFTPNILLHDGTYYLYYTGVGADFNQDYNEAGKTGIGVATASNPYGPWTKYENNPILVPSSDTSKFDSFRVDDTCMTVRDGEVWMYYKGRPWGYSSAKTKMGVAVASNGLGPFVRQNDGDPVQLGGHEVQIWMDAHEGVYSMVNGVGPSDLTYTIQYAADGLNFTKYADISSSEPSAPGLYRPELTNPAAGGTPEWGVYGIRQLGRYDIELPSSEVTFSFDEVSGVGSDSEIYRCDPSDIIKIGDTWHVWYCKSEVSADGPSTIWHATSTNAGIDWVEQDQAIELGSNAWDSDSVFAPNVLLYEDNYYLYYTGVGPNYWTTSGYVEDQKFRIGVACSDSPDGPWTKYEGNPILSPSTDTSTFDSFRVDDSCLAVRDGNIWLYYQGWQWNNTSANTMMGLAIADDPFGPFTRQNEGEAVQLGGHEVQIWMDENQGVYSLVGSVGSDDLIHTIQYAADGLNFSKYAEVSESAPSVTGMYRTELTDSSGGGMPEWGMYGLASLARFDVYYNDSKSTRVRLNPNSIVEGNQISDFIGSLSVSDGADYTFECLDLGNADDFTLTGTSVSANTVFDASFAEESGFFVRASSSDSSVDAYFEVAVLEASGIRAWRLEQFGSDVLSQPELEATVWGDAANPDGDAFDNASEYGADTLPLDADSTLRIESIFSDGETVQLTWVGGTEATQYLESSDTLDADDWDIEATYLSPTDTSNGWSDDLEPGAEALFYRIRAER
jgi:predicted GH43/DUF377 family glycosyl hydrolase